jgi:hypothetical protein
MKIFRKAVRNMGETLWPTLWHKLAAWRAARANRRAWDERIADVLACADNARLRRVTDAGKIVGGCQIMHNGLKVIINGYYGEGITRMLAANGGCHEPQEEVVFDEIIRKLPAGAVMMEVGAYWGYYSMWFSQIVKNAKVFLVEPASENIAVGRRNFQINGFNGDFTQAYVGQKPQTRSDDIGVISIESFVAEKNIAHLNLLHSDIQGFELEMLRGAKSLLDACRIDYVFVSTHTSQLHKDCADFLIASDYHLLVSINLEETHSFDGILIAHSPLVTPPAFKLPSKKPKYGVKSPL